MATKIILPEMGEGVIEGTLARWLVNEGDEVEEFDAIAEVETDKVSTETMTETSGTVLKLCVAEGETVPVGTVLAYIGEPGEDIADDGEPAVLERETDQETEAAAVSGNGHQAQSDGAAKPEAEPVAAPGGQTNGATSRRYTGRISPLVGRIAAEHDVDLNRVPGTGRDGRITKNDILAYVEERDQAAAAEPAAETAVAAPSREAPAQPQRPAAGEILPLTNMRRAIAEHMVQSKRTSPHVTTVFEFDFAAVVAHRRAHKADFQRDGANLTFTVYMVAAVVQALKAHPLANSTWTDDGILLKREINIGMAAAVDDGLVVPVIKNADQYSLLGLARVINDLTERARNKKLTHEDLRGGTFSITNHGTTGSLLATPIINQPQAGILGFGKIEKRVKVIDDAIAIRPLAYASFTFDHRILDGATADAFVAKVQDVIENWQ